jgi:hypothetical protein
MSVEVLALMAFSSTSITNVTTYRHRRSPSKFLTALSVTLILDGSLLLPCCFYLGGEWGVLPAVDLSVLELNDQMAEDPDAVCRYGCLWTHVGQLEQCGPFRLEDDVSVFGMQQM